MINNNNNNNNEAIFLLYEQDVQNCSYEVIRAFKKSEDAEIFLQETAKDEGYTYEACKGGYYNLYNDDDSVSYRIRAMKLN